MNDIVDSKIEKNSRRSRPVIKQRQERIPLGKRFSKLTVPNRQGYQRRWLNDKPGRIEDAKNGGWSLVDDPSLKVGNSSDDGNSELGSAVSRTVGVHEGGGQMRAYLMEIPQNMYNEDQQNKSTRRINVEKSIIRGDDQYNIRDERGREQRGYVPLSGNQITRGH